MTTPDTSKTATDAATPDGTGDPLPGEQYTQLGYAARLVHVYGHRIRFMSAWGKWMVYDGSRWRVDDIGQARQWMSTLARRMTLAVQQTGDRKLINQVRWAESAPFINGSLSLASTYAGITIEPDQLDADPYLVNCANGTLDLHTGELRVHDPKDLQTKITRARYDPDATGEAWERFLERVQPDKDMRQYLARLVGHALEGRVSEHILPIFYGQGANGKGTFINATLHALGDYADAADSSLLVARNFESHPTSVADLYRLRLAILSEGDSGQHLGEGTVKRLTGGDRIKARRMREDFWAFDPSHTFIYMTNHKPVVTGTDNGIWRRLRLVPWDVVLPPEEWDTDLPERLQLDADAILAWLVAGYRDWREHGLEQPVAVTKATAGYRTESDDLGRFITEVCTECPRCRVRSSDLYDAYRRWSGGAEDMTQKAFSAEIEKRGYEKKRTKTAVMWLGIGLAAQEPDPTGSLM